ncbi:MAG: fibronectin type III domain-containing protein [Parcubacteria group bacterium]
MAPTNKQLLILLILLIVFFGFGFVAKHTIAAFKEVSLASLNMAGVETDASFGMIPAKIKGLTADIHNGEVTLTWSPIMKAKLNGYRIYRGTSTDNLLIIGGSSQPGFEDKEAKSGGTYYYRVAAINDLGEGHLSTPLTVKVK